jgi:acetolactate synthase I/II/III large subunit
MTETRTGAELLVDCLLAQGVDTAFGVPGESYLAVLDALYDVRGRLRLIPNRQEGGAGFMAAAWGKLTGRPGIAFVTRGPGATNAAIGVHAARQDSAPMILFVGQVARSMRGREAFQELDYRAAFGPLAKWATEIDDPARIPETLARAFATAMSGRPGPVVVALPEDMLAETVDAVAGPRVEVPRPAPDAASLAGIAGRLACAARPLVIASGGSWSDAGRAALRRFAESNRLPVLVGFRCNDFLDNDSPSYCGDMGLAKPPHVRTLVSEADLVIAIGARFGEILSDGYTLFGSPPRLGPALVHVHPDPGEIGKIYGAELPVVADPVAAAEALSGLPAVASPVWTHRTEAARAAWLANLSAPPQPGSVDMGAVVAHLQAELPEDAILANGAGNFSTWTNRHFRYHGRQRLLGPQAGAMGYGLPAAIAAKLAHPDRTVVCLAGDGDLQMTVQELGCALQAGAAPIVLVVNNASYGTIRMHQERSYPGRVSFTDIVNPDFPALARAYGLHAERVSATSAFPEAFARARAAGSGALLDLAVDVEAIAPRQTLSALRAAR